MSEPPATTRFTVVLDAESNARFDRLVGELGRVTGPLPSHRGRRSPSRADLLRAALVVLEEDRPAFAQVRTEVLRHALGPSAASEVRALVAELRRGAAWLSTADAQESAGRIIDSLDALSRSGFDDVEVASEELRGSADRIAWLAVEAGGYEGLRPLLDIARRLRLIRDAIDPAEMQTCLFCDQDVRLDEDGRFERHNDQAGSICQGGAR